MKDRFSSIVFLAAGIHGPAVLVPGLFSQKMLVETMPPAIPHAAIRSASNPSFRQRS